MISFYKLFSFYFLFQIKSNILIVFLFFFCFRWVTTFQLKHEYSGLRASNETDTTNSSKTILKRFYKKKQNTQSQSELPKEGQNNGQKTHKGDTTMEVRGVYISDPRVIIKIPKFEIIPENVFFLDKEAYTIEKVLGKGGLGLVCLVEDSKGTKQVAKFPLHPKYENYEEKQERIKDIMLKSNENNCENLIKFYNYGFIKELESPVLLMQYIEGVDGRKVDYKTLSKKQIKDIMISLTKGLQCLNEKMHRYHGDFKLVNFMVDKNVKPTIIDIDDAPTLDEYTYQHTKRFAPLTADKWPKFFPDDEEKTKEFVKSFDQFSLGKVFCDILRIISRFESLVFKEVSNKKQRFLQISTIPDLSCTEKVLTKTNAIFTPKETRKLAVMIIKLMDADGNKRLSFKETLDTLNEIQD